MTKRFPERLPRSRQRLPQHQAGDVRAASGHERGERPAQPHPEQDDPLDLEPAMQLVDRSFDVRAHGGHRRILELTGAVAVTSVVESQRGVAMRRELATRRAQRRARDLELLTKRIAQDDAGAARRNARPELQPVETPVARLEVERLIRREGARRRIEPSH